jgi:WD40 repeat protein
LILIEAAMPTPNFTRIALIWVVFLLVSGSLEAEELRLLLTAPGRACALSPDGKTSATGEKDGTISLWDVAALSSKPEAPRGPSHKLLGHEGEVWTVAFSPDGKLLASGGNDKTIRKWDVASGKPLSAFEGSLGWVQQLVFSSDSAQLLSSITDNASNVWDVSTGKSLAKFEGSQFGAFSPDGRFVLTGDLSGAWITSLSGERAIHRLEMPDGIRSERLRSVTLSPKGDVVATTSGRSGVILRLYEAKSGRLLRTIRRQRGSSNAAFSPDGKLVVVGVESGCEIFSATGDEEKPRLTIAGCWSDFVTFSPDGALLACAGNSRDCEIRLFETSTGTEIARTLIEGTSSTLNFAYALQFSPDSKVLAAKCYDEKSRLFEISK